MYAMKQWVPAVLLLCAACLSAEELKTAQGQLEARNHARVEQTADGIVLKSDTAEWDAGLRINPPAGQKFDFSQAKYLAVDVENLSKDRQMRLTMHISSGGKDKGSSSHVDLPLREVNSGIGLNPGEKRTMRIYLPHAALFTAPEGGKNLRRPLETAQINSIEFKMQWPFEAHRRKGLIDCRLSNLRLEGGAETAKKVTGLGEKYFPFFDNYGQYKHGDWAEKIHSDAQLKKEHERELATLAATPDPVEWDRFGGWKNGPQLEATGSFRTEKYEGKWFFVTPEGRLFWSTGIDVLRTNTDSIKGVGHEKWFSREVPESGILPFTEWNLQIRYGKADFAPEFYEVLVKRLRAWGINTVGNWGASDLMLMGKMPYTLQLADFAKDFPRLPVVKFYDVFDPVFETKMGNILRDRAEADELTRKSIDDPMCIGYFIDNELQFGRILEGVLKSAPAQPAKVEFVNGLKAKYGEVAKLNAAWETDFADWPQVAANKTAPKGKEFRKDADAFLAKFLERYFELCAKGVKSAAPHRLYLGCRFVGFRQSASARESAVKYCDVVSVNTYTNSVNNMNGNDYPDKPVLIGEFHFGTYDRGMFSDSLAPVWGQEERATSYTRYLQGALVHPNFVGAHYFQFRDQPLTGRWDGEGYQIGFVDVADTPYRELTQAAREVGENMYQYRIDGKLANSMK